MEHRPQRLIRIPFVEACQPFPRADRPRKHRSFSAHSSRMLRRDSRSASLLFPDQPIQSPPSFRNRGTHRAGQTSRTALGDPTLFRLPQSQRKTVRHDDQAATRDRFQAQVAFSLIKLPLPLPGQEGWMRIQKNVGVATLFRAERGGGSCESPRQPISNGPTTQY